MQARAKLLAAAAAAAAAAAEQALQLQAQQAASQGSNGHLSGGAQVRGNPPPVPSQQLRFEHVLHQLRLSRMCACCCSAPIEARVGMTCLSAVLRGIASSRAAHQL